MNDFLKFLTQPDYQLFILNHIAVLVFLFLMVRRDIRGWWVLAFNAILLRVVFYCMYGIDFWKEFVLDLCYGGVVLYGCWKWYNDRVSLSASSVNLSQKEVLDFEYKEEGAAVQKFTAEQFIRGLFAIILIVIANVTLMFYLDGLGDSFLEVFVSSLEYFDIWLPVLIEAVGVVAIYAFAIRSVGAWWAILTVGGLTVLLELYYIFQFMRLDGVGQFLLAVACVSLVIGYMGLQRWSEKISNIKS